MLRRKKTCDICMAKLRQPKPKRQITGDLQKYDEIKPVTGLEKLILSALVIRYVHITDSNDDGSAPEGGGFLRPGGAGSKTSATRRSRRFAKATSPWDRDAQE